MPVSIRFRLLLLVLSVLVPWTLGTAWLISSALQAERAAHEQRLRDTARALAMVVDHELAQRVAIARVLAQSRWLDAGPAIAPPDLRAYEQLARRSIQGLDGWIELRTQDRLLLDTRWPPGAPARADPAGSALAEVPQVLPLRVGNAARHAAVVQPVERGGRVVMNLTLPWCRPNCSASSTPSTCRPTGWAR